MKQKTIRRSFHLEGTGLHSGKSVQLIINPAPPNAGIFFDKEGNKIPATIRHLKKTDRGTSLNGIAVVEHILSAAYGLGLDNLEVKIVGDELPALDGSALPYVEGFERAGIFEQKEAKNFIEIKTPIRIIEGDSSLEALPSRGFQIHFMVDFPGAGVQRLSFDAEKQSYRSEIAPARTFGYLEEYELLKKKGLALGATFENALVLGKEGYMDQPRFSDEVVRHKILDLIGDLCLLGSPLQAEVFAVKSGHKLNTQLVRRILKTYDEPRH